jgi:hypothetical protein
MMNWKRCETKRTLLKITSINSIFRGKSEQRKLQSRYPFLGPNSDPRLLKHEAKCVNYSAVRDYNEAN